MDIEELAFKNITEISELPREILLHIIVILQQDRKCWIEQYTRGHNDYIDIQTRIDKAIEYIKNNIQEGYSEVYDTEIRWDAVSGDDLLEILKGSDK